MSTECHMTSLVGKVTVSRDRDRRENNTESTVNISRTRYSFTSEEMLLKYLHLL